MRRFYGSRLKAVITAHFILIGLFSNSNLFGQNALDTMFGQMPGTRSYDYQMEATPDGGVFYYCARSTSGLATGYLLSVNKNGKLRFEKDSIHSQLDVGVSSVHYGVYSNSFIVVAMVEWDTIEVTRIKNNGVVLWRKKFKTGYQTEAETCEVVEGSDEYIYIVIGGWDTLMDGLKIDLEGNSVWHRYLYHDKIPHQYIHDLEVRDDTSFHLFTTKEVEGNFQVVVFDTSGLVSDRRAWSLEHFKSTGFMGGEERHCFSVSRFNDDNFLVCSGGNSTTVTCKKISNKPKSLWSRTMYTKLANEYFGDMIPLGDTAFVMVNGIRDPVTSEDSVHIVILDSALYIICEGYQKIYDWWGVVDLKVVNIEIINKQLIIGGPVFSKSVYDGHYIMKDTTVFPEFLKKRITSKKNIKGIKTSITIHPNPASNAFTISLDSYPTAALEVSIVDLSGRLVHYERSTIANRIKLRDLNLQAGIYMVEVRSGGEVLGIEKLAIH